MTGAPPARPAPRHRPAGPAPPCATPSPTSACKALRAHIRILPAEAAPSTHIHIACPLSTWAEARLDRTDSTLLCPLYSTCVLTLTCRVEAHLDLASRLLKCVPLRNEAKRLEMQVAPLPLTLTLTLP